MTIDRKTIRSFMEEVMRELLFENNRFSRYFVCDLFSEYANRKMTLDEKIEFINILEDYGRNFVTLFITEYGGRVVIFRVDPARTKDWERAMNSITQEE